MRKHEITFLAQLEQDGPMVLVDRVKLDAKNTQDAAERYARLFVGEEMHLAQLVLYRGDDEEGNFVGRLCMKHTMSVINAQPPTSKVTIAPLNQTHGFRCEVDDVL